MPSPKIGMSVRNISRICLGMLTSALLCLKKWAFPLGSFGRKVSSRRGNSRFPLNKCSFVEYLPPPVKSASDQNQYTAMKLPNGLVATLVTDVSYLSNPQVGNFEQECKVSSPTSRNHEVLNASGGKSLNEKLAACALAVEVGSFSDPDHVQGLAHLLEHVIFMGSEKYPKENDFGSFLSAHGGRSNASTTGDVTTFHFTCPDEHLFQALDVFSNLFVSPLLKWDAVERERESVESEFQTSVACDDLRKSYVLYGSAVAENPVRKFHAGNQNTLKNDVTNESLHKSLKGHWSKHYSADRMKLAIKSRIPVEIVEQRVMEYFSKIPTTTPNHAVNFKLNSYAFDMKKFCKLYRILPVNDVSEIDITWVVPPTRDKYKTKPLDYITYLLCNEGSRGLTAFLRDNRYIISLSTDEKKISDLYTLFTVNIVATERGLENWPNVVSAVFSYLKIMKEPQQRIFEEMQIIADTAFRFREDCDAVDTVTKLCVGMTVYPSELYLTGEELYFEYGATEITSYIEKLSPDRANIAILSKNHENLIEEERWYKTKFSSEEIPSTMINEWKNIKPYEEFSLPKENIYLASNFSLVQHDTVPKYPGKIYATDLIDLWYKGDDRFLLPFASVNILVISDLKMDPGVKLAIDVAVKALMHQLIEDIFQSAASGLRLSVDTEVEGVSFGFSGYNQNLGRLLETVARGFKDLYKSLNDDVVEMLKDQFVKGYGNFILDPGYLAGEILTATIDTSAHPIVDYFMPLCNLTTNTVKHVVEEFFKTLRFQALVQGNVTPEDAIKLIENFVEIACSSRPLLRDPHGVKIRILPIGEKCLRMHSFLRNNKNCVTTIHYQYGPGTRKQLVALKLFNSMMEEPLFDSLRTKEQLGYSVTSTVSNNHGILGLTLSIVSQIDKFSVDHVKSRMDTVLYDFVLKFHQTSDDKFASAVASLVTGKRVADTGLSEESGRNFETIVDQTFVFDWLEREISILSNIEKAYVSKLVNTIVSPIELRHRKMVVQVVARDCGVDDNEDLELGEPEKISCEFFAPKDAPKGRFITEWNEWRDSLLQYPVHKFSD